MFAFLIVINMKISDAHTDFLTEIKDRTDREEYVKSIRKIAGVISCAVFTTFSTINQLYEIYTKHMFLKITM